MFGRFRIIKLEKGFEKQEFSKIEMLAKKYSAKGMNKGQLSLDRTPIFRNLYSVLRIEGSKYLLDKAHEVNYGASADGAIYFELERGRFFENALKVQAIFEKQGVYLGLDHKLYKYREEMKREGRYDIIESYKCVD